MNKIAQVVVIGGGPSGCAAALSAYNNGCNDVVIIEKEPYGRHRIGEILLTQTILELKDLNIHEEMAEYAKYHKWGRKFAAAYVHGEDRTPWKVQNNHPLSSPLDQPHVPRCFVDEKNHLWYTLMVKRHEYDEALRAICQKKGIKVIHGALKDFHIIREDEVDKSTISSLTIETLNGETIKMQPQFIIDATGQQAFLARKIKARKTIDDWGLQARYTYFNKVDFDNAMKHGLFKEGANILSFEDGWCWIANLGTDVTSIGIVSRHWDKDENHFWKKLSNLPEFKTFGLDKAVVVDHKGQPTSQDNLYVHPNYRFRSEIMRGRNWVCAGDAAMFLDPLLSQGVTLATSFGKQAGALAKLITEDSADAVDVLRDYERSYIGEIEVLNKVVSQWYTPEFKFDKNWLNTAQKISTIFGREIGKDVESFRWVSNLENIHHILKDKNDKTFLKELNDVNTIKMIHDFEKDKSNYLEI